MQEVKVKDAVHSNLYEDGPLSRELIEFLADHSLNEESKDALLSRDWVVDTVWSPPDDKYIDFGIRSVAEPEQFAQVQILYVHHPSVPLHQVYVNDTWDPTGRKKDHQRYG